MVALWLTAAPLASTLHAALVRHAVCGAHGELIHVEGVFAHGRDEGESPRGPGYQQAWGGDAHSEDAHCILTALLERHVVFGAVVTSALASAPLLPGQPRVACAPRPIAVLDYAPKASPPVV